MKKSVQCKICNLFDLTIRKALEYDLFIEGLSYNAIINKYSSFLPQGETLSASNVSQHKRHCSPQYVINNVFKLPDEISYIEGVFRSLYQKEIDRVELMKNTYKERIRNLFLLQNLQKVHEKKLMDLYQLQSLAVGDSKQNLQEEIEKEEKFLLKITKELDFILHRIQEVLLKDERVEKGLPDNVYVTQINIFQNKIRSILDEFVPYILLQVFPDNPTKGRQVLDKLVFLLEKAVGENEEIRNENGISTSGVPERRIWSSN